MKTRILSNGISIYRTFHFSQSAIFCKFCALSKTQITRKDASHNQFGRGNRIKRINVHCLKEFSFKDFDRFVMLSHV